MTDEDKRNNTEVDDSIERFTKPDEIQFISEEEAKRREQDPKFKTIHLK